MVQRHAISVKNELSLTSIKECSET